jgi:hypothetical protein
VLAGPQLRRDGLVLTVFVRLKTGAVTLPALSEIKGVSWETSRCGCR